MALCFGVSRATPLGSHENGARGAKSLTPGTGLGCLASSLARRLSSDNFSLLRWFLWGGVARLFEVIKATVQLSQLRPFHRHL